MKVISRSAEMVQPEESTPATLLWNTNVDLVVNTVHTRVIFFFQKNESHDFFSGEIMRNSLAKVLVPFYPMAGRLQRDENGRIEINCNAKGVLLIEAQADVTIADLGNIAPRPEFLNLIPKADYTQDISSYPLLLLQITVFKCGGVCLGVGMHHHLGDAMLAVSFFKSWATIARGLQLQQQPVIDRNLLKARSSPSPSFCHIEYEPPPLLINISEIKISEVSVGMFKMSRDQLQTLKNKARDDEEVSYSSYEILAAHIWRCICQARELGSDQKSKLYVAVDGRSRLEPSLPHSYLGNAIFTCAPVSTSGDLLSNPLCFAARKLHDALQRMDNEYLRSALDYLEMQPDLRVFVKGAHTFKSPNLSITSWKFPWYEVDFGWGKPIFFGPVAILSEGFVYVLPSPCGDGSLTISLGLQANHMPAFAKLIYDF